MKMFRCSRSFYLVFLSIGLVLSLILTGCGGNTKTENNDKSDKYVELVKNGSMEVVPNVKVGEAFAAFFVDGSWKSFEAEDKTRVVEFNGGLTWKKKPAQCTIQFLIKDDKSFELGALAINDVELSKLESLAILEKILKGDKPAVEKGDDPIAKMQKQFAATQEVSGTVLATSYGHSEKGSLSLVKNKNGSYSFILVDEANHQMAGVEYSPEIYNLINVKPKSKSLKSSVIFNLSIYNDTKDADKDSGAWYGGRTHMLPIHAQYVFDGSGLVVPGMLHTARGEKPSHYQDYLKEQKNVDLANLFLTEMQALHKNAEENNLSL